MVAIAGKPPYDTLFLSASCGKLTQPIFVRVNLTMPMVLVKDNDSFDRALRAFKRSCEKAGIMSRLRSLEFYEKPTWERKRKGSAARKRHLKRLSKEQEVLDRSRSRRFVAAKTVDPSAVAPVTSVAAPSADSAVA
jgi:small subunit ribosomal protein S21